MSFLQNFLNFLLNQKSRPSPSTVKNYKADISQFINWFENEFNSSFNPLIVTPVVLHRYKLTRRLSENSFKRHTSSLRKFFSFLKTDNAIAQNPLEKLTAPAGTLAQTDPWMLKHFKNFLYEYKKSNLTIKNYINDIESFFAWLSKVALLKYNWDVADKNLLNKINPTVVEEYKQRLIVAKFLPTTINRKLSSLRSYINWAKDQGFIKSPEIPTQNVLPAQTPTQTTIETPPAINEQSSSFAPVRLVKKSGKGINFLFDNLIILPLAQVLETMQYLIWKATGSNIFRKDIRHKSTQKIQLNEISNIKKAFYAPLDISVHLLPFHKRVWHYLCHVRPSWYKSYHSYPLAHYFHFALLMIFSCTIALGIYNSFSTDEQKEGAVLGSSSSSPPRILSFQGKLTDSSEAPIITETTILFSLYDTQDASSGAALWKEEDTIQPDSDGIFSILLGKKTPIPNNVFSYNSELFLGITVGNSQELKPRQQLATVPYASNSETLQGLRPITNTTDTTNVILALNSSGNLSIAGSNTHTFQTIGGEFVLSGKVLSLVTAPGSNSNIKIVPDGTGKIDLSAPILNSTNDGNITSMIGSVEFDDTVAILATSSSQTAFYINQTSTGPLISANTNDAAKFTVGNEGNGIFAGDLGINGGDLTSSATTFNLLNSTVTSLSIGGAATTLNLGVSGGDTIIKSNLTLSSLSSNGGILYTNGSGKIFQVSAGSSSDCLLGGATPAFGSCGSSITSDVFWSSSLGAVYPSNSTLDFLLGSTSTASALIKFTGTNSPGTNSSWFNAGNVGIGTTAPLFKLDISDSQSATVTAQISNTDTGTDADGLIVKLGNTSTSAVASSNHFVSFETAGIGIVGSIQGNGSTGVTYATSGIADFAEYLKKDKNEIIEYGSLVCLKDNGLVSKCDSGNNNIVGVASERPAFLGGQNLGDGSIAVGLVGQIETLIAITGEGIKAGDTLAASEIPGVAIKTTTAGQVLGKALENLTTFDESIIIGFYDPENKEYRSKTDFPDIPLKPNIMRIIKLPVLVNVSWYDPEAYLAQNGNFTLKGIDSTNFSVSASNNEILSNSRGFFEIVAAKIKAGLIEASEIATNTLIVTSDSLIVNGQYLRDYIATISKDSGIFDSGTVYPNVNADQLAVNIISPLSSSHLVVKLATPSGALIVQNASGSAITKIDDQGNAHFTGDIEARQASFSGELQTNELLTNQLTAVNASISGTLRADNIIANSILGLEDKISSIYSSNFANLASYSAQLSYVPDLAAERAQFNQGLIVFGSTNLSDLSVAERLSVGGTMFVMQSSIESLGTDLSLQSLRQGGLSIMGGLVYIDTEGNIKIQGDLTVNGKLIVNVLSPSSSNLVVNNASGSSVLSVNQTGDVTASGSGTFTKLNLSLIHPVLAVSSTEVIASSSAGLTNIAPYQSEITINNALVTDKSVIYITPVGTPSAQSPFLIRQIPGKSFTVGVQSPTNHFIEFNWLIIN